MNIWNQMIELIANKVIGTLTFRFIIFVAILGFVVFVIKFIRRKT